MNQTELTNHEAMILKLSSLKEKYKDEIDGFSNSESKLPEIWRKREEVLRLRIDILNGMIGDQQVMEFFLKVGFIVEFGISVIGIDVYHGTDNDHEFLDNLRPYRWHEIIAISSQYIPYQTPAYSSVAGEIISDVRTNAKYHLLHPVRWIVESLNIFRALMGTNQ